MEFSGQFKIEGATVEEVWLALSDPVLIRQSLDGCQYAIKVDDRDVDFDDVRERARADEEPPTVPEADPETIAERAFTEGDLYAFEVGVTVGSVNPTFELLVEITEREFPRMEATAEGGSSNSSVEVTSWMDLSETDEGVTVEWGAETEVFGRIAQLGQRVINPVANQVVNRFFSNVEAKIADVGGDDESVRERIRNLL